MPEHRCLHHRRPLEQLEHRHRRPSYTIATWSCRAGTPCHWDCYESRSTYVWVWTSCHQFEPSCAPFLLRLGDVSLTLLVGATRAQDVHPKPSMPTLPAGIVRSAMLSPIVVWSTPRGRQHRARMSSRALGHRPISTAHNCIPQNLLPAAAILVLTLSAFCPRLYSRNIYPARFTFYNVSALTWVVC